MPAISTASRPVSRGWPKARRLRQRALLRARKPWLKSTGPRSDAGKAKARLNALKTGAFGAECQAIRAYLRAQRAYVKYVLACLRAGDKPGFPPKTGVTGQASMPYKPPMRSTQFDDIYFSAEDGLAETQHTFLAGNNLPAAWAGRDRFCICETGFGTGLNMLAAWRLFEETAKPGQRLDLISIEKYPLTKDEIRVALRPWCLQPHLDRLLEVYPLRVRGFHRLNLRSRVTLTLVFGDVQDVLPQLSASVDAWFLDGFAPAKNPDMWNDALYANMARLSHAGTSVATFTAAGDVRRGLTNVGFNIEKKPGYGRKRDMVTGKFVTGPAQPARKSVRSVAVLGAGIAGLSAAWHLRQAGVNVTVYDSASAIASGASGNATGLINPKLTAQPSPQSDYYTSAYAYALQVYKNFGLTQHGSLHLQTSEDKARRFFGYTHHLGWNADHMQWVDAGAASDIAGMMIATPALYYPDAALASPRGLCEAMARGQLIKTTHPIINTADVRADAIILANASGVTDFCAVPVDTVRGQVTYVRSNGVSSKVKTNICYGGYFSPRLANGTHVCGATFQPWNKNPDAAPDDDAYNLDQLSRTLPTLGNFEVAGSWAGFRAATPDRFPLVGFHEGVYLTAAHGSHGMSSGIMAGAILSASLTGEPLPVGLSALGALHPGRFKR